MEAMFTKLRMVAIVFLMLFVVKDTFAVGALFSRPRFSTTEYQKMWIKSLSTKVDIQEQIAVTTVDQVFNNELNTSVEAIYIFPLPENATITKLVYWVNGKRYEAAIRERQQAINDYNQKLRQWLDPALLEYLGNNLFRLSIVPIDANSDVRTEITYVEPLKYDLGLVTYNFKMNTLGLSSKPLQTVSVNLDAKTQYSFKKFYSPSHENSTATKIEKISDNHYTLFYGDENFYPDKDLTIAMQFQRDSVNFSVLTYSPTPEDSIGTESYYAIWITPPDQISNDEVIPKDIVFTADVSSSMEGQRIAQVKEALNTFLDLLNPGDKFNIITFGTFVDKFQPDLVEASANNIQDAKNFVTQLYALGMTNIDEALTTSLQQSYEDTTSNDLVFLTDGMPTWGETNGDSIIVHSQNANKKDVRVFSFGVGDEISQSLLTNLSAQNHGYAKFITSDDSIALVVNDHFKRISKPVLTDINITTGGLEPWDIYPKTVNDLFWGSQVMEVGMYNKTGSYDVALRGKIKGKDFEFTKHINFSDTASTNRFVPRLWAKTKIDHILSLIAIYGETQELVDQIIELSLKYQIITPYTSFYVDPNPTEVKDKKELPDKFNLAQNYPNPFNPVTFIRYTLPDNKANYQVIIKVYNSLGQLITTLVNEEKSPGTYQVLWNGKDSNGKVVTSGVYFYTIRAGDYYQIKKMLLLK